MTNVIQGGPGVRKETGPTVSLPIIDESDRDARNIPVIQKTPRLVTPIGIGELLTTENSPFHQDQG